MNRRDFLTTSSAVAATSLLSGCNEGNHQAIDYTKQHKLKEEKAKNFNINRNKKTTIKLATSWPAHFPIMGRGVERFAERVEIASGGSLKVKLYPKNTLVPALAVFDATSSGQLDAFHSGPYYWKGKNSAFSLFSGAPFSFTASEINAWMNFGNGLKLWREMYAKFNLHPFLGGNTNVQMGGWFRKEIKSLKDMQGLKMRIPGLGGEVVAKMGVNPVLLPAGEIYTSLERGVIDATEWVGPALDIKMGFYKVAPYYYTGWHEPGSVLELTFNKQFFNKLSTEHQSIIEMASNELNSMMGYEFSDANAKTFQTLQEKGVKVLNFPDDVMASAKESLQEVVMELSQKSSDFKLVYEDASSYLKKIKAYNDANLRHYLNIR